MSQPYRSLTVDRDGAVAHVTLTGPGRGNAMGPDTWNDLAPAFRELDEDDNIRAVIVRGSGDHFSYGLDLMAMMPELGGLVVGPQLARGRQKLLALIQRMQQATAAPATCSKPVIAAVDGWCIGGGLDLIAACDVRICSARARFSLREIKLAIVADLGSLQRLPAIIGQGHTRQLAFTGEDIDAARAQQIGLVNDVYDSPEALYEAAAALAGRIAKNSPVTATGAKEILNYSQGRTVEEGLRQVAMWNTAFLQSTDLAEAIAAYMERREPRF